MNPKKYTSLPISKLISAKVEVETEFWWSNMYYPNAVGKPFLSKNKAHGWYNMLCSAYSFEDLIQAIQLYGEKEREKSDRKKWTEIICPVCGENEPLTDCKNINVNKGITCGQISFGIGRIEFYQMELLKKYLADKLTIGKHCEALLTDIFK